MPTDPELYARVTREAKKRFRRWPSAYASAWVVKEYKRRGGRYSASKSRSGGVRRWMKEEWIQVSPFLESGAKVACGAKRPSKACRPSKRVSAATPATVHELVKLHGRSKLKRMAKAKESHMKRRMRWTKKS